MIGSLLIDSVLYFMAFIPIILVPVLVLQVGPYLVINGINTLMKADEESGSAERYFGIEPEEDLLETETYKVDTSQFDEKAHTRLYILMKVLSVITVALILGSQYSNGNFEGDAMIAFLMNNLTVAFLMAVLLYAASMMALFNQFKDHPRGKLIEAVIFYCDGLVISTIAGIIIATLRF